MQPNIIIMLMDNLGYGDLGCYGSRVHRTPNVDRLAAEGMRFTDFYSCSGVCTPSRASLMTGCYPRRVGLHVSETGGAVLRPVSHRGLHPAEVSIARVLRDAGYATACIGKWHLGDQLPFLPTRHGFDHYLGIPYSEDMVPMAQFPDWPPLPLLRQEEVIEAPVSRETLTQRYTEESIRFISDNRNRPFFLYLAHAMPGSTDRPFASSSFQGVSANGPYGDAVEELDWSTGAIMATLAKLGLDERTLVVWTSDNGAVERQPPQGSNAPLRGWGYDTSEGSQRVPCLVRWPGRVPAGTVCGQVATMMDWLPTCARLAGTMPPADRTLDGHDLSALLAGKPAPSAYDETGFFYYFMGQLQAVRWRQWKLYLPLPARLTDLGRTAEPRAMALYDVHNDLGELHEVADKHPDVVQHMLDLAEAARADLGDQDRPGAGQRPAGWVDDPTPRVLAP